MDEQAKPNRPRLRFYDAQHLPAVPPWEPRRLLRRILVWLSLLIVLGIVARLDLALMRFRYTVLPKGAGGFAKEILYGFRDFGQTLPIVAGMVMVACLDRRRRGTVIVCMLVAQALANVTYNAGKLTIERYRPFAAVEHLAATEPKDLTDAQRADRSLIRMKPQDSWLGWSPALRDSDTQSFPSGHSGAAFAFAGVIAWFYPQIAVMVWVLATGCACSRYLDAVHWPSDCMAGAMIGYAAAWLALRPYAWSVPLWIVRKAKGKPAMGNPPARAE